MQTQLYTFIATEASLSSLLDRVSSLGSQIDEATRLRAQTVLEELFANSLKHGYADARGSVANHVWLTVRMAGTALHVRYEDAAPPFNPFENLETVVHGTLQPLEARPVGGLGRLMVQGLSDSASYTRIETQAGARNRIDLVFTPRDQ